MRQGYHKSRHLCILRRDDRTPPARRLSRTGRRVGIIERVTLAERFDVNKHMATLSQEERDKIKDKAINARKKLHPAPQRKKEITGERLRLIEETTDRIRQCLATENVSYVELAKRLEMTPGHISHLMSGTRNMTLSTLADIAEALGYQFTIVPTKK